MWWLIKNIILLPFLPFRIGWWLSKGIGGTVTTWGGGGESSFSIPRPITTLVLAILIYFGVLCGIVWIAEKLKG